MPDESSDEPDKILIDDFRPQINYAANSTPSGNLERWLSENFGWLVLWTLVALCLLYFVYATKVAGDKAAEKAKRTPRPVIVSSSLVQNFSTDNQMIVKVRNDGPAGKLKVVVYSYRKETRPVRGETGLGKTLRENLTTEMAPPDKTQTDYKFLKEWSNGFEFASNSEREFHIELPGHSVFDGVELGVRTEGIEPRTN